MWIISQISIPDQSRPDRETMLLLCEGGEREGEGVFKDNRRGEKVVVECGGESRNLEAYS